MSDVHHVFPNFVSGGKSTRCPKGHAIPDKAVACPECALESGEKGLLDQQAEFLRKARAGEWNYTLRVAKGPQRHALLYSTKARTFCGQMLKIVPQVEHAVFDQKTLSSLCPGCRAAIASVLQIMDGQP